MMVGQLLDGRYQIIRELSSGGFGQTFVAEDTRRPGNPQCVVKKLKPHTNDPQTLEVARRLFKREAEVLERLGEHSQIPRLLADFEEQQEFYLVEEFIVGHLFAQELVVGQPLLENQVVDFLKEILPILGFVHSQGVIHRDIKPSNIIRRQSDRKLVLIDFGAVKEVATQLNSIVYRQTPTVVGTPEYMPLEQFHGQPRFNSDIYALGVICVQAVTGVAVQDISSLRSQYDPDVSELVWHHRAPYISTDLTTVIDRMILADGAARYQSVAEVLAGLAQIQPTIISSPSPLSTPNTPPTLPTPNPPLAAPQTNNNFRIKLIAAGVGAALLLTGLGIWGTQSYLKQRNNSKSQKLYYQGFDLVDRGVANENEQEYKQAIGNLDRSIKINPKYGEAYYQKCRAQYLLRQDKEALDTCSKALEYLPSEYTDVGIQTELEKSQNRIEVAGAINDSPAAKAGVKKDDLLLEINGKSTENMSRAEAEDLLRQGTVDSSVNVKIDRNGEMLTFNLKRQKLANPYLDLAHNYRGLSNYYLKQYPQAIADFDRAIAIYGNYSRYYLYRARAKSRQGDKQGALSDINQTIKLDSRISEAYYERGLIYYSTRANQPALEDFNAAINLNNKDYLSYYQRGEVKLALGNKEAAIVDYTKAIEANPKYIDAYLARSSERNNLGRYQEAIADTNQIVAIDPNIPEAYINRGLANANGGQKQAAINDYTQAIKIRPRYAIAYNNRGLVREGLRDKEGANNDYTQAIEIDSNYPSPYYNRGLLKASQNDKPGAIADFRQAAQLYLNKGLQGGYRNALFQIQKLEKAPASTPSPKT
jgi:serine/threonine protein kinase/Flp pilus assembly protein TadD